MRKIYKRIIPLILCLTFILSACGIFDKDSISDETIQDTWKFSDSPDIELVQIAEKTSKTEVLKLAEKYYNLALPKIEDDLLKEFHRIMTWNPIFDGSYTNSKLAAETSLNIATAITYTNAKNYYLALSSATFAIDTNNVNSASNFATAIATYCDDLQLEEKIAISNSDEFYSDAITVYFYALTLSDNNTYGQEHLAALSCLGNLFLDMKKFDEAYAAFEAALKIDKSYNQARTGLYNYYMATNQKEKALKLLLAGAEYLPAFTKAVKKIGEKVENQEKEVTEDATVEELEVKLSEIVNIPEVTVADFIEEIDPKTATKIRRDMDVLKKEMSFKAPNIDVLLDKHITFEDMSKAPAISILSELAKELGSSEIGALPAEQEESINRQLDLLNKFGADIDLGFDSENISEIIQDAMKNPEKYENWNPEVKIEGVEGIIDNADEYLDDLKEGISKAEKGDSEELISAMAEKNPAYRVLLINPYEYLNSRDIIIQQFNMNALLNKMTNYNAFFAKLQGEYGMTDILSEYTSKSIPMQIEYSQKISNIEKSEISEEEKMIQRHKLHEKYFPKLNEIAKPLWSNATSLSSKRYKKIEKYIPQMYNDCMKHIVLVSDSEVREELESELKSLVYQNIQVGLQHVISSYTFAQYFDLNLCGCDSEAIRQLEKQVEKQRLALAKERAKEREKLRNDRKNFDNMILDEKSEFYKEKIAKYEYDVDLIFLKYKSNPYKSLTQCKLDFKFGNFNGSILENHYRNTTTYDGNLELGGELESGNMKVSIKGGFGFTATQQSDGNFYPEDIDLRAKLEAETGIGDYINVKSGIEASALRGTKAYSELSLTGNEILDKFKDEAIKESVPIDVNKTIWNGEYIIE